MNTGASWPGFAEAQSRVHAMQTKLHQWAIIDPGRQFDELGNLMYDPAFLVGAWDRVRTNKCGRSAGVDGIAPRSLPAGGGAFLDGLPDDLKARRFTPTSVRDKMIPEGGGKQRRLGIPTLADRVVQAALKPVLEPIFRRTSQPHKHVSGPRGRSKGPSTTVH